MRMVSSTDVQRSFSETCDAAIGEPHLITQRGRPRLVLCSHERYHEMWNAWMEKKGELADATDHPAVKDARARAEATATTGEKA